MLVPEPGELHEDEAALRLAAAVGGSRARRAAVRTRAGSTWSPTRDGVLNVRIGGPRAPQPDRSARGLHGVRRPGRRARRPGGERQGRAARRRCRDRRRRARGWPASAAIRWSGSRRSSPSRVGVIVKESVRRRRARGSRRSVRAKIEGLGSTIVGDRRTSRTMPRRSRRRWPASSGGPTRST